MNSNKNSKEISQNLKPKAQDAYGFQFWLFWILGFAASFLVSAAFWTWLIGKFWGSLAQPEYLVTWALSVFGSWFLILTPFMRKKEQIWKRLNHDQEKATNAWLLGMGCFIAALILLCLFWGKVLQDPILQTPGFDATWAKYVLASWLLTLLPFLVFLYKKADQIYKAALARQTQWGPQFKTGYLEKNKRMLPEAVMEKIRQLPETLKDGHVLELTLQDGKKIPHVFVFRAQEILGIYDATELSFEASQVSDVQLMQEIPPYEESRWLRLDGRA